ncbi:MAG: branched-chain amino acid ABC transporter permease [Acidimicrobiia bacterium]
MSPARALGVAAVLAAAALAAVAPALVAPSTQRTLGAVFMFATLAQAWNLIGGMAGYPSFGQVVFFGLGGYTVAVLMAKAGWAFWPALPVAVALGAAFAVAIGVPVLRLRGHYFAIATLGIAEGTREVVINLPRLTGGGAGITVPAVGARATTTHLGNDGFYWCFLVLAVIATITVGMVVRSRFGFSLRAIHQDEAGAGALGIDTTRVKVAAFAISGALTAAAGAIYAFQQVTIYPDRLFSVEITVLAVAMAVVGGAGTVAGPLLGAGALQLLSEYLRQRYLGLHLAVFGAVLIASVVFVPQGLVSFTLRSLSQRRLALLDNVRRHRV